MLRFPLTRLRVASFGLTAVVLAAACIPGARAPNVAPRGTIAPDGREAGPGVAEGPFRVVFGSPRGETVDPSEITLVFSRPLRPLDVAEEPTPPPVKLKPEVAGQWMWVGTTGLVFTPKDGHLPGATEFTVEVPQGTRSLGGETLEEPFRMQFSTPRPELSYVSASHSRQELEPGSTFELRFNQPVDDKEIQRALTLRAQPRGVKGEADLRTIAYDLRRPDPQNDKLVTLVPKSPLPLDAAIEVVVSESLRGREGPLPARESKSFDFHTYGPLRIERWTCSRDTPNNRCSADSGFSIDLTNGVKLSEIKRHLKIEPAVKIRWPSWLDDDDIVHDVSVWAKFTPGASYRVRLDGIRDVHGQPLVQGFNQNVPFDDLWPTAAIGLMGSILDPRAARGIPVSSVNAKTLDLAAAPLDESAVLDIEAQDRWSSARPSFETAEKLPNAKTLKLTPTAPANKPFSHTVKPEEILGGKDARGPLAIAIRYTERPGTRWARVATQSRIAQVTDLGISAKVSTYGSLVWVTRLSTGEPIEGASVHIARKGAGQPASFKTDKNGFATIPKSAFTPEPNNEHGVIFARLGDDWSYIPVADALDGWRYGVSYDLGPDRPFGLLFTDRGIYRPGDTVRIKGILREEAPTGTATPANRSVHITVEGPEGDTIKEITTSLSVFGTLAVDVPVPMTGRLGTYSIQASVEGSPRSYADVNQDFEVAEYRPAEFKVGVESNKPSFVRGDKASWTARGDYLFGAPMTGADVRMYVTRSEAWFSPPGFSSYTTDDASYLSGRPESSQREYEVQSANTKLNDKGTASTEATLTMPGQTGPELVTAEADVTDLSRQMISSSTSAIVHPGEFYIALDAGEDIFVEPGKSVSPRVLTVDPKGTKVTGTAVKLELIQRKWTVARQEVGGGYRTQSSIVDRVVSTCAVTTAALPASCALTPDGSGYYIVRATATDRRKNPLASSTGVYVTGEKGFTSWGDSDEMKLELVPDKKSYEVGQTARVLVKSPFPSADAWITVERAGVYSSKRVALSGPMPTIDVPITDDLRPNAFVSVLLVRGRTKAPPTKTGKADVGAPAYRIGYAALPINPEARRLAIKLKPNKTEARPGDTLEVDVDVSDRAGKPAHAEVTLYAVDEGVLSLIGYQTPDPIRVFGAPRALKVATLDARDNLARVFNPFRELGLDKGQDGGDGGGGGGRGVRRDFRASAYFNPTLVTDARGHAHASFKLPDSLTTYRIMAVAAAEDDRFGYAQDRVVTSRPLMARPALPRFLRAGDSIDAGVVVTSKGLDKATIEVSLAAEGLKLKGPSSKSIELETGKSAEVRFAIDAPRAGKAKLRFVAKGGGNEDAVEVNREIQVPTVMEAVALYGDTTEASAEKIGNMNSIRTDVGGLEVALSSTALVGLGNGAEQLIEYPYGCTEQLTSRLVPMLPLRDLAKDYGVALPKNLDGTIRKTVAEILTHQRGDGGFGFWSESPRSDAWVSAYALWGLSTASRYKISVPERALTDATSFVKEALERAEGDPLLLATSPFILDVLAERGAPDPGRASRIFEIRDKLPLFSQALLLHAMVLSKNDPAMIEKLVSEIEGHVRIDANVARAVDNTGDRYAVLMDSEARTSAMVLRGLMAARPGHAMAARLAMGLLSARSGGTWRNTQETAWSLLALDDYRKAQEKVEPDFTAQVFLGEGEIFRAGFHGRSLEQPRTTVPSQTLAQSTGAALAFSVEGKGRLFYEARLRYAPKTLPRKPIERGFFVKKTLRPVDPSSIDTALQTLPQEGLRAFKGGDLVLGDIVVVAPSPREYVVIDDPLPAGFEAVDVRLATTGGRYDIDNEARYDDDEEDYDDVGAGRAYRSSAFIREIRDDRVLFFVDRMGAGMYHYRYLARATTLGSFVLPPTKAEEMYTPEVFGRTGADVIRVDEK